MSEAKVKITEYRGYKIHTSISKTSHSSVVYKDGYFITATAGDIVSNGKTSVDKAKIKIDNLLN